MTYTEDQLQYAGIIKNTVPQKYRQVTLENLKPSERSRLSLDDQEALYAELLAKADSGWAFFAPAGYSKTTCSYALYRRAVWENFRLWWPQSNQYWAFDYIPREMALGPPPTEWDHRRPRIYVWRKSVPDLLQQHFTLFNHPGSDDEARPQPDITVEKIEEAVRRGFKPRVFLEEIDKIKPSEFAINQIFRIFDALDRHRGQLVIDTNLSKQEFMDIYGEPIARRVKENCNVKEYGFGNS
jgi:hypothetical protein